MWFTLLLLSCVFTSHVWPVIEQQHQPSEDAAGCPPVWCLAAVDIKPYHIQTCQLSQVLTLCNRMCSELVSLEAFCDIMAD